MAERERVESKSSLESEAVYLDMEAFGRILGSTDSGNPLSFPDSRYVPR
jgi:hypothetical protein